MLPKRKGNHNQMAGKNIEAGILITKVIDFGKGMSES